MGRLTNFLVGIAGVAAVAALINGIYKIDLHAQTWRQAAFIADAHGDNNKIISSEEYATIYQSLGLKNTGRNATDLSKEQLQKYISIKNLEDYGNKKNEAGLGGLF